MKRINNKIYHNEVNYPVLSLMTKGNSTIIDLGCGSGANAQYLRAKSRYIDGVTLSEGERELAKLQMREVYIHNLEDGLPDIQDSYDYFLCSHVLEHLAYHENLFRDIRKAMKDNSELIIAVPNVMFYKSRLLLISGEFPEDDSGIWDYTHLRWFTKDKIKKLFDKHGFIVVTEKFDVVIPFGRLSDYLPNYVKRIIASFLEFISPGLFSKQLIYVVKKN